VSHLCKYIRRGNKIDEYWSNNHAYLQFKVLFSGMMAMISVGLTALPVVAQRPTPLDPAEPLQGLPQPKDLER
jgi:hypothetical protein